MGKPVLVTNVSMTVPDVSELGRLYQRAIEKDHRQTALSAEQAVIKLGVGEAAIVEARTLAAFLDAV